MKVTGKEKNNSFFELESRWVGINNYFWRSLGKIPDLNYSSVIVYVIHHLFVSSN